MARPQSIILFERLYLGALALGILNTALNWSAAGAIIADEPALAGVASWYQPVATAIGIAIPLLLWYFIARRGSPVAKWIMVVLSALAAAGLVWSLSVGSANLSLIGILGIITVLLNLAAAWTLFRPDAKPWFGEVPAADAAA
ncbi:hypothetical protein BH09PSE4_BH09PSE4_09280 [soil metagenome]